MTSAIFDRLQNKYEFEPSYTWPNPAFPFRIYYESSKCRIFIIENIQHNWNWLLRWSERFRETDFFLVYCGWYHSAQFANEADTIFSLLELKKENFFFMYNSPLEMKNFSERAFQGELINHNAWLDENLVMRPLGIEKIHDAIYVARRSAFKRHMLASKVARLALVAGINHGNSLTEVPPHDYLNSRQLSSQEVCEKVNASRCGLILSAEEGACFASSEYLLCGVPVVSTSSKGGRDVWYNQYNSIVCAPDADEIAGAVEEFIQHPRDPHLIRELHIKQAEIYRDKFVGILRTGFDLSDVDVDPRAYFVEYFFHKLRKSYKPEFEKIFT